MSQYKDCSGASGDDSGFYARARLDEIAQLRAESAEAKLADVRRELDAYQALQAQEQIDPPGHTFIERALSLCSPPPRAPAKGEPMAELGFDEESFAKLQTLVQQLRAELAQVTAERDEALASEARLLAVESKQFRLVLDAQQQLEAERAAHAETRKALEEWTHNVFGPKTPAEVQVFIEEGCRVERELAEHNAKLLESTRAELAKAEARVKEADRIASQLKGSFDEWPDDTSENDLLALDLARILEALRGRP